MAQRRRAGPWKWTIAGTALGLFAVLLQGFHGRDAALAASRPADTPIAAQAPAPTTIPYVAPDDAYSPPAQYTYTPTYTRPRVHARTGPS